MSSYVLGCDLGTMGTKTALYSANGRVAAEAFQESKISYPRPGVVEQDPDDIFASAVATIRAVIERSGVHPGQIAGIAFDGQMAGMINLDANWGVVTPYDSWLDTRCARYIPVLKTRESEIIASSGGAPSFNHGAKMLFWKNEHPEIYARIAKFTMLSSYVAGRMAGLKGEDAFIDRSYLGLSNFADTSKSRWNVDLVEAFGLDPKKMPRIVDPWEIIGAVTPEMARLTGLAAGTPIAAGCGDATANILGAGIVEPGTLFDVAGTASVLSIVTDRFATDTRHKMLYMCPHAAPGLYFAMAYVNGGGLNLRWFRDQFGQVEKLISEADGENVYQRLGRMAEKAPPGAGKLLFLPHLGGRVCPNNATVRGAIMGLSWGHTKNHIFRAILEGIGYEYAYYLKACRDLMPEFRPKRIVGIGGGARSRIFKQIKADILGVPYMSLDREECGTLGAALVAGHAAGLFSDMAATAESFTRPTGEAVSPDPERHAFYQPLARAYVTMLESTQAVFDELAAIEDFVPSERAMAAE